ncbi:MAG: hypothetical protein OCD76_07995 [Reichenbachiella sp.]
MSFQNFDIDLAYKLANIKITSNQDELRANTVFNLLNKSNMDVHQYSVKK